MSAFDGFDDIWCINQAEHAARWIRMQARFAHLGIADRVKRFPAVRAPAEPRVGRALSHRRIIQDAFDRDLRSVLVIEDETVFLDRTDEVLDAALVELRHRPWKALHLGSWRGCDGLVAEPGCTHLWRPGGRTGSHALAYGHAGFADLLSVLPSTFAAMTNHLGAERTIDHVLAPIEPAWMIGPAVATVPWMLAYQAPEDQVRFIA